MDTKHSDHSTKAPTARAESLDVAETLHPETHDHSHRLLDEHPQHSNNIPPHSQQSIQPGSLHSDRIAAIIPAAKTKSHHRSKTVVKVERNVPESEEDDGFVIPSFLFEGGGRSSSTERPQAPLQSSGQNNRANFRSGAVRGPPSFHAAAITVKSAVRISKFTKFKRRSKWVSKKVFVFIISNGGLVVLVSLYAILGGILFQHLEKDSELASKKGVKERRNRYITKIWNATKVLNVAHNENWTKAVDDILFDLEHEVFLQVTEEGWDGTEGDDDAPSKWTFPGALLFSITVITTIGYGEIVPTTELGQVVCIVYAIVGIPLTLLCLANIGSFLANVYRFIWKHLMHFWRALTCNPNPRLDRRSVARTKVPITMSITTMVGYVMLGALIFSEWEKDWSFLDGSYFCFITLSTIGFGDYVPGQGEDSTLSTNKRQVICILYLIMGLALLSMVFQLIIENVSSQLEKYASMLGLSSKQIDKELDYGSDEEEDLAIEETHIGSIKRKTSRNHKGTTGKKRSSNV